MRCKASKFGVLILTIIIFTLISSCESEFNSEKSPKFEINVLSQDFGRIQVGDSEVFDFVISNTGKDSLSINDLQIANLGANTNVVEFKIDVGWSASKIKIKPSEQHTITIKFFRLMLRVSFAIASMKILIMSAWNFSRIPSLFINRCIHALVFINPPKKTPPVNEG